MKPLSLVMILAAAVLTGACRFGPSLQQQAVEAARVNPPPAASDRTLGVHIEPCILGAPGGTEEVEGETFYCGTFTVPQDWDEPNGARIDLAFMVAKATGDDPEPDPLVFIAGGPGQSSVATALTAYERLREGRDIVRLDQRGAGLSQRLGLEECLVLALQDKEAEDQVKLLLAAIHEPANAQDDAPGAADSLVSGASVSRSVDELCWKEFTSQGLDLDTFTTAQSARDVIELLKALDYSAFNVHGISYGTRMAMRIMSQLEELDGVPVMRAAVLDSPFPPSVYLLSTLPRNSHDLVMQLLEECRSDPVCAHAYPDLQGRLSRLLGALESEPLRVDGRTVTADDLIRVVTDLRGTRAGYMPRMIAEFEAGRLDTYLRLARNDVGVEDPEGIDGLDRADPVQAFLADAVFAVAAEGGMAPGIAFIAGVQSAILADDPRAALESYLEGEYEGELRDKLLELAAPLRSEDFERSPMIADARRQVQGAPTPSDEERAAAKARADRLLAVIEVAHFLNKTIHCSEDLQYETLEDGLAAIDALEFPQLASEAAVREQAQTCEAWPVTAEPESVKEPISSAVPTLVLQGAYDTRTPVFMGVEAATQLPHAMLAVVPQQGHEVWVRADGCAADVATAFILDPSSEPDLACLEDRRPSWELLDE